MCIVFCRDSSLDRSVSCYYFSYYFLIVIIIITITIIIIFIFIISFVLIHSFFFLTLLVGCLFQPSRLHCVVLLTIWTYGFKGRGVTNAGRTCSPTLL